MNEELSKATTELAEHVIQAKEVWLSKWCRILLGDKLADKAKTHPHTIHRALQKRKIQLYVQADNKQKDWLYMGLELISSFEVKFNDGKVEIVEVDERKIVEPKPEVK